MNYRKHFLPITLTLLIILLAGSSYVRFIHNDDYMVTYEGDCNPHAELCFIGCDDEDCQSKYYYKHVYKYAATLYDQCGPDISDCEAAQTCLENEAPEKCYFEYCTPTDSQECSSGTNKELPKNTSLNSSPPVNVSTL